MATRRDDAPSHLIEARVEDLMFLMSTGQRFEQAVTRVGEAPATMLKRLERAGLALLLSAEHYGVTAMCSARTSKHPRHLWTWTYARRKYEILCPGDENGPPLIAG